MKNPISRLVVFHPVVFRPLGRAGALLAAGVLVAFAGLIAAPPADAHGKATAMQDDACTRRLEGRLAHFAVYLPDVSPREQFCDDLPKGGDAIVVMDLVDPELRKVPIGFSVVKAADDSTDEAEAETIVALPAQTYPHGVIRTDAALEDGHYFIVVQGAGPQPFTYKYDVWVGRTHYGPYILVVLGLLLAGGVFYSISRSSWVQNRLAS